MHPDFKAILTYLRTRPVNLTITSNGHSVAVLEDYELRAFHDIEFSLDYPTQAEQDEQRGPGNWELIHQQAERCVRLGVPVTIIAVMMKSNYLRLADVARVAKQFNAPLRVNVYQAVRSDLYALTYEEYWQGFRRLFESTNVIAIGEPLVRAMAGLPPREGGCGVSTVRVTPRASTQPCVYWPGSGEPLADLIVTGPEILNSAPFEQARTLPEACQTCEFRNTCHGGCAGRRRLQGALLQPDFYCPLIRGERPRLPIRMADNSRSAQTRQLLHNRCDCPGVRCVKIFVRRMQSAARFLLRFDPLVRPRHLDSHIRKENSRRLAVRRSAMVGRE